MSPYITSLVLGLIASSPVASPARPDEPAQAAVAPDPAPPGPAGKARSVILLSNGNLKVHEGTILEEGESYVLKHRSGTVRLPRRDVERVFGSIEEVYTYKVEDLPDRDPDEHMKLALWCLSQKLPEQAEEQLRAVLAYIPDDRRALGMLKNLQSSNERRQQRDEQVAQAAFEADAAPGKVASNLDRDVIDRIRSYKGPASRPEVFDLPEGLAVRRYQEFGNTIHPLLQNACAGCHDENSGRNFQVIRARSNKDLTNDLVVRNNLGATLGLIDRTNPAHSPLLVNAVTPHGPDRKPILPDPNSPAYRALWTWVESLKHTGVAAAAPQPAAVAPVPSVAPDFIPAPMPAPATGESSSYGGGFGADRGAQPAAPPISVSPAAPPPAAQPMSEHSSVRVERREGVHPGVPVDADFQTVSPLLGGPNTARLTTVSPTGPSVAAPAPADGAQPSMTLPDGSQFITLPDGSQVYKLKDGTTVPVMNKAAVRDAKPASEGASKGKDRKIDPKLLERFQRTIAKPGAPR